MSYIDIFESVGILNLILQFFNCMMIEGGLCILTDRRFKFTYGVAYLMIWWPILGVIDQIIRSFTV